jgi:hydrogenase maturation protease
MTVGSTHLLGLADVVVVDAVRTGRPTGAVSVVDVATDPLPAHPGAGGSHGFGVAEAVELSRVLGRLPRRLVVVGVEAGTFGQGAALSREVERAVGGALRAVEDALSPRSRRAGER